MSPRRVLDSAVVATILLAIALIGCRRSENRQERRSADNGGVIPSVRELSSPAAPGSGEPNLTTTPDGRLLLSWIEPVGEKRHRLRFASRAPGSEWSAPATIAEGNDWFVNWADFPAVTALADGRLYAHWLERSGPGKYAYDVRIVSSADGGRTWSAPLVPHRDRTEAEHGFVSMTPWSDGRLGVVWLDGRKIVAAKGGGHGHHGDDPSGAMMLLHTTVAPDGSLGAETVLDDRVCDCCQTSAAPTNRGFVVAYRDRTEKEVRDIAVVRHQDGRWSAPQTLGSDHWEINGCPVNGPSVAAAGERVAVAWFTAPGEKARVNVAFSSEAGESFGGPISVDEGRPIGRVDVALLSQGDALVSWMEQTEKGVELRVRRVSADGQRQPAITVADSSAARSSGFPRMELSGREAVFAWRDPAEPSLVRTAVMAIR